MTCSLNVSLRIAVGPVAAYGASRRGPIALAGNTFKWQSEEEHVDWLETQLGLIEKAGLQNYQQSQA